MKFNDNGEVVDLQYSLTKDAYYNPKTGGYVDKYGNPCVFGEHVSREPVKDFFDDLPSMGDLLEKNIAEEKAKKEARKEAKREKMRATAAYAGAVGLGILGAAKAAGHSNGADESPVKSNQEYMNMIDDLF